MMNSMEDICLDRMAIKFDSIWAESYIPSIRSLPLPQCEICVIVPVKNEAQLLPACLKSLAAQTDLAGRKLDFNRYEVILLANNCTDNSVEIARKFAQQHPKFQLHIIERTLPPLEAYIGRVRQLLMDEAYYRLARLGLAGLGVKSGIIASTDGDTQVSPTWIAATLLEISRGVDAVGGRIVADPIGCQELDPQVRKRYLRGDYYHQLIVELETYLDGSPHDRWPRHAQHYGASLAVTAQMYRQCGGMPAVRTPEDVAFYRALLRVGAKFRHSPLVEVTTSARQTVRTMGGFAAQLNEWQKLGQQACLVESAAAIETRFRLRRQLRELWHRILNGYQHTAQDAIYYARKLGIGDRWLWTELSQPQSFDRLFERVEASQQQRWQLVDLDRAIADLDTRLQNLRPLSEGERG